MYTPPDDWKEEVELARCELPQSCTIAPLAVRTVVIVITTTRDAKDGELKSSTAYYPAIACETAMVDCYQKQYTQGADENFTGHPNHSDMVQDRWVFVERSF